MRLQSIKLLILLVAIFAGLAVAGRLAWFLLVGRDQILSAPKDLRPKSAVNQWWEIRKQILSEPPPATVRAKLDAYAVLASVDISGQIPPEPKEPEIERPVSTTVPYDGFSFVRLKSFILGDGQHPEDDRVYLHHPVEPARAGLGDAGKLRHKYYTVGESLVPLPEIRIEKIDRDKSEVVFRMPKFKDLRGEYQNYKGDESDSQTKSIALVDIATLPLNLGTGSVGAEESTSAEESSAEAVLSDGREPPEQTRETFTGSGVYEVGSKDITDWNQSYAERLEQDVTVKSYNRNGVKGLHVQRIDEASTFFGRGVMKNDVILSINGSGVPTKSSAVRYFKENPNRRTYTVQIQRNGRKRELLYQVPR